MAVQPIQSSLDAIMKRIDAMIDELQVLRQAVLNVGEKVGSETIKEPAVQLQKRSVVDILAQAPTTSSRFQSAKAVEQYIAEERNSWDDFHQNSILSQ